MVIELFDVILRRLKHHKNQDIVQLFYYTRTRTIIKIAITTEYQATNKFKGG